MKMVLALAAALVATASTPARAGEVFAGLFGHDVHVGFATCCFESGTDYELGARTDPLPLLTRFGDFRLYALGSANDRGGVGFGAAGLLWRIALGHGFYFQPGLGGAVQSGSTLEYQKDDRHLYLGSRVLFEPEASLGYRISPRWGVEATYAHLSHARLAGPQNPGMDEVGARLTYSFGR